MIPGYFQKKKREEEKNRKKSLAAWFPAYLLYLPGSMKSYEQPLKMKMVKPT